MTHIGETLGPLLQSSDNTGSHAACLHAQIYDMRMRAQTNTHRNIIKMRATKHVVGAITTKPGTSIKKFIT